MRNDLLRIDRLSESWGVAWGDVDGDGDRDLWLSNHGKEASLLINHLDERGGTFEEVLVQPQGDKHGAVWGDLDRDGDQDLLQLRGGARGGQVNKPLEVLGNQLFTNTGGTLTWLDNGDSERDAKGLYYSAGRGRTPTLLDANYDGRLDVVVGNDPRSDGTFASALFLQERSGRFAIARDGLGVPGNGVNLAIPADFDGDGLVDLFLRNDIGPNRIVLGDGKGFVDSGWTLPKELLDVNRFTEDVIVGDFNNDDTLDVWLVTRSGDAYERLFLNLGGGRFVDASVQAGLHAKPFLGRNGSLGDFDNDGDLDVYTVNADYTFDDVGGNLPNTFWENGGTRSMVIDGVQVLVPMFAPRVGRRYAPDADNGLGWSVAVAEVNGDGTLDLLVSNGANGPNRPNNFLVRQSVDLFLGQAEAQRDWLMIDLVGVVSNSAGIGSTVRATVAGETQMRFAANGMHNKTQDDARLHFGFGELERSDRITLDVTWTSGAEQRLRDIRPDQYLTVTENAGHAGDDVLRGTVRDETLAGGLGADTLDGMNGADTFAFADPVEGGDVILGFSAGRDRVGLSAAGFGFAEGSLGADNFARETARGRAPQVVYDPATGVLAWDGDGAGGAAPVVLATLVGTPYLTPADIVVIA